MKQTYQTASFKLFATRLFYTEGEPLLLRGRTLAALPIFAAGFAVPAFGLERMKVEEEEGERKWRTTRRRYLTTD